MKNRLIDIIAKVFRYLRYRFSAAIIVNGWFYFEDGALAKNNFGDDICFPILERLTGCKVIALEQTQLRRLPHLVCIGSVVDFMPDKQVILWGGGTIMGKKEQPLPMSLRKVCAVRGPLTRDWLLGHGVDCPAIYGDPALLLPLVYKPKVNRRYKVGFVPHYADYSLPHVEAFRQAHPEVCFIRLQHYTSWQQVIDEICSCDCIVSSSLHGLIVSDAYGVPNVRACFSDLICGGDYKYKDYYGGVGRQYVEPLDFRHEIDLDVVDSQIASYRPIHFNLIELLRAFPYRLAPDFRKLMRRKSLEFIPLKRNI